MRRLLEHSLVFIVVCIQTIVLVTAGVDSDVIMTRCDRFGCGSAHDF